MLVSPETEKAYYQREEIAAAIELARSDRNAYRVVPLYLGGLDAIRGSLPYGLRLKHGINILDAAGLADAADKLTRELQSTLVMSPEEIQSRYKNRVLVDWAVRLVPKNTFDPRALLGPAERKYVFVGDYVEQRNRNLRQVLSNLWAGDAFEPVANSNVEWVALKFEIGELNRRKLDLKPATWKAAFRILSDPKRANCFRASDEERARMGVPPRDYYSDDQDYWYHQLTAEDRRYTQWGIDYYIRAVLGLSYLCFDGSGITYKAFSNSSTVPSRVFLIRNVPAAEVSYTLQELGTPADRAILA